VGYRVGIRLSPKVTWEFKPPYRFSLIDEGRVECMFVERRRSGLEFGMRFVPGLTNPTTDPQATVWNANTTSSNNNAYFFIPYLPVN